MNTKLRRGAISELRARFNDQRIKRNTVNAIMTVTDFNERFKEAKKRKALQVNMPKTEKTEDDDLDIEL